MNVGRLGLVQAGQPSKQCPTLAEMTADAEEYSAEERDELQEYINELQKEIDYYWGKFLERKRQKESYVFEKGIENIMAWKSQLDTILDTENP